MRRHCAASAQPHRSTREIREKQCREKMSIALCRHRSCQLFHPPTPRTPRRAPFPVSPTLSPAALLHSPSHRLRGGRSPETRCSFLPTPTPARRDAPFPASPASRFLLRDGGLFLATYVEALAPHLPNECDRFSDGEHCSQVHSCEAGNEPSCADEQT